jgi:Protein of unknown function (DUF3467)
MTDLVTANPGMPINVRTGQRSPDYFDIYSNANRMGVSPFDLSVTFSRIADLGIGVAALEDLGSVRMSPQQFKLLVQSMAATLSTWEEVFGTVTIPTIHMDTVRLKDGLQKMKDNFERMGTPPASPQPQP